MEPDSRTSPAESPEPNWSNRGEEMPRAASRRAAVTKVRFGPVRSPRNPWHNTTTEALCSSCSTQARERPPTVLECTISRCDVTDAFPVAGSITGRADVGRVGDGAGATVVIVHVPVDRDLQRARVLAARAGGDRPAVLDPILEGHRASVEAPGEDEEPLRIDAAVTRHDGAVAALVDRISARCG